MKKYRLITIKNSQNSPEITIFAVVILLMIVFSIMSDNFLSLYNLLNLLKQISITGIIAIAMSVVLISGGIDLSVGESCGISAIIFAMFTSGSYNFQIGLLPAIFIAVLCGTLVGVINGLIISYTKIPPFIATIGVSTAFRGVIKLLSGSKTIAALPDDLNRLSTLDFLGVSVLFWVYFLLIIIVSIILGYTVFGRNLRVLGSGFEVARLCGIKVKKHIILTYSLSAFLCGIAGCILTIRLHSALPNGGSGYAMIAISGAVIGGISFSGAKGRVIGSVIGSFLLLVIENGGIHIGVNAFIMEVITGILIIGAVVIDRYRNLKHKSSTQSV